MVTTVHFTMNHAYPCSGKDRKPDHMPGEIADDQGCIWLSPIEKAINGKVPVTHRQALLAARYGWTALESTRTATHVQVMRV